MTIDADAVTAHAAEQIMAIATEFPGDQLLVFELVSGPKTKRVATDYAINPTTEFQKACARVLRAERV